MIRYDVQDAVAQILLDHPPVNGLKPDLLDLLMARLRQVGSDPQVLARGMVHPVSRPDGTPARVLASPIRMSRSALRPGQRPPLLGENNADVAQGWPAAPTV
jgi:crotonobetainyl-CoA:carnitine CoA-transferase CaiB-like acyl-CoA transferase